MAKKKHHKKQSFKYGNVGGTGVATAETIVKAPIATSNVKRHSSAVASTENNASLMHVKSDVRRLTILAVGFVVAEMLLWVLFNNTKLGEIVYSWIKL